MSEEDREWRRWCEECRETAESEETMSNKKTGSEADVLELAEALGHIGARMRIDIDTTESRALRVVRLVNGANQVLDWKVAPSIGEAIDVLRRGLLEDLRHNVQKSEKEARELRATLERFEPPEQRPEEASPNRVGTALLYDAYLAGADNYHTGEHATSASGFKAWYAEHRPVSVAARDIGYSSPYAELCHMLATDDGYRESWLANIACCLMDAQGPGSSPLDFHEPETRNRVAGRIMNHCFPIKGWATTKAFDDKGARKCPKCEKPVPDGYCWFCDPEGRARVEVD